MLMVPPDCSLTSSAKADRAMWTAWSSARPWERVRLNTCSPSALVPAAPVLPQAKTQFSHDTISSFCTGFPPEPAPPLPALRVGSGKALFRVVARVFMLASFLWVCPIGKNEFLCRTSFLSGWFHSQNGGYRLSPPSGQKQRVSGQRFFLRLRPARSRSPRLTVKSETGASHRLPERSATRSITFWAVPGSIFSFSTITTESGPKKR